MSFEAKRFGDYEICKPIGKGKFAVVYRARHISTDEIVALKRINVDSIDDKAREKTLHEVRLLQSLDHPNVIRYMDSFITDNDLVIVFEWAAAGDLKRQLRKAQERGVGFEERVIWKYFSQICDAIQHMHERRIMHRDLKPANIFLTLDGTVKVGDLGLSRSFSEHTVQAHSKVGTPLYMSPEVLRGDGYDFKSDVWSLGCLLYELAMLKSPFKSEGLNLYLLFQKISQGDYQPLPENYSEDLRSLTYAMISTKSEDRPEIGEVCTQARKLRALFNEKSALLKRNMEKVSGSGGGEDSASASGTASGVVAGDTSKSRNSEKDSPAHVMANLEHAGAEKSSRNESEGDQAKDDGDDGDDGNLENIHLHTIVSGKPESRPGKSSSNWQAKDDDAFFSTSEKNFPKTAAEKVWSDGDKRGMSAFTRKDPDLFTENTKPKPRPAPVVTHRPKQSPENLPGYNQQPTQDLNFDVKDEGDDGMGGAGSTLGHASVAFALMECVYDRLIVLGFPMEEGLAGSHLGQKLAATREYRSPKGRGRLLPMHFACDLALLGAVAGYDGDGSRAQIAPQFRRLVEVALWLLQRIGGAGAQAASKIDVDRDAPVMISKQLLGAAQAAGVAQGNLTEVVPTALSVGHGEKACAFLLALADRAWQVSPAETSLRYVDGGEREFPETKQGDGSVGVNEHEEGDEEEEEEEEEAGEDYTTPPHLPNSFTENSFAAATEAFSGSFNHINSIQFPTINPALWREETERVAKQLSLAAHKSDGGWSEHVQTIQRIVADCYSQDGISKSGSSSAFVSQALTSVIRGIKSELAEARSGEGLVNARQGVGAMSQLYATHRRDLTEFETSASATSKNIQEMSEQLAVLDEKLGEVTEKLEEKAGGSELGSGGGATITLREGIRKLKLDIVQMATTMGLLDADLTQKRKMASKGRQRQRTTFGKISATNREEDELL